MVYRNPRCVYVANSPGSAEVVANYLGLEGIPARVMDRTSLGGLLGLTVGSNTGLKSRGLEIWVVDEKNLGRARQLLAEFDERDANAMQAKVKLGPVEAMCEDCHEHSIFAGKYRGSVQNCAHCGAYIDVPDGVDEMDGYTAQSDEL